MLNFIRRKLSSSFIITATYATESRQPEPGIWPHFVSLSLCLSVQIKSRDAGTLAKQGPTIHAGFLQRVLFPSGFLNGVHFFSHKQAWCIQASVQLFHRPLIPSWLGKLFDFHLKCHRNPEDLKQFHLLHLPNLFWLYWFNIIFSFTLIIVSRWYHLSLDESEQSSSSFSKHYCVF